MQEILYFREEGLSSMTVSRQYRLEVPRFGGSFGYTVIFSAGDDLERFQAEAVELKAAAAELRQLRAA